MESDSPPRQCQPMPASLPMIRRLIGRSALVLDNLGRAGRREATHSVIKAAPLSASATPAVPAMMTANEPQSQAKPTVDRMPLGGAIELFANNLWWPLPCARRPACCMPPYQRQTPKSTSS